MTDRNSYSDIITALEAYSVDIANWRIEQIEREMRRSPDKSPDFTQSLKDIDNESRRLIQELGGDCQQIEPLMKACIAYHSELIHEVYRQAVLDGGRVFEVKAAVFFGDECTVRFGDGNIVKLTVPRRLVWTSTETTDE